jgi:hypothetical protein
MFMFLLLRVEVTVTVLHEYKYVVQNLSFKRVQKSCGFMNFNVLNDGTNVCQ